MPAGAAPSPRVCACSVPVPVAGAPQVFTRGTHRVRGVAIGVSYRRAVTVIDLEPSSVAERADAAPIVLRDAAFVAPGSTPTPTEGSSDTPAPGRSNVVDPSTRAERWALWTAVAAVYLFCAWRLASHGVLAGDAMSRTLSAANTVTGRDPHLESIGFIWPPFPALFQVPLTALSGWFPALVRDGLAGTIVSALLMATMVSAMRRWLEECGLRRLGRVSIAVLLALHPFVLLFASNGMSEASMLCFLVIAANRLSRWWERETPLDLIACGLALAMAYLSRYEVGLAILLVGVTVFAEGARRASGDLRARARRGLVCAAAVSFIPLSAATVWALWSWTTIGEPFAQFTSQYGNSAIVAGSKVTSGLDRLVLFLTQALIFGGIVAVLIAASLWFGTRGFARIVAVVVVMLSPLAFNLAAAYSGTTFGFARFMIALIPAGVMLMGPLLVGLRDDIGRRRVAVWAGSGLVVAAFAVVAVMGLPVIWHGHYGTGDEAIQMTAIPGPYRNVRPIRGETHVESMRKIAADIDAMGLPDGAVLSDDFTSYLIVASSNHRTQFITTPDRDFERVLSAPRIFGVKYLLVPDGDNSNYDAVRDVWPGVFDGSNPIGKPVKEWGTDANPARHYRLVKVTPKGAPGS